MSLQRRLLLYLLLCAPLVWGLALLASADRARSEVNELFDTEIIRLARQVQSTLVGLHAPGQALPDPVPAGEADLRDLAIAVWNAEGRLLLVDREGVQLPCRPDISGFVDLALAGDAWRVYYLQAPRGEWLVAAGQRMHERDELVRKLVGSQLLPWLLVLPVLLAVMTWAVRRALAPLLHLAGDLQRRSADDLQPMAAPAAPAELKPLLAAMNGLFTRIETTLERERRFTADAAHELRTPLAVLRAQWDVVRRAADADERAQAAARLGAGLDRMDRMVEQLLALSRLEATGALDAPAEVQWAPLVEQVMSDVLPLAERRRIELGCDWPPEGEAPFPLRGSADLLALLLRNLLDNAVRYAPAGGTATLRFTRHGLAVENNGPALPAQTIAHLGERFHRPAGQAEAGSGLGVSIAQRIAALHGLALRYGPLADGRGVRAELSRE
ncbi:MAG: sensor histidine kinase N-terminal domain-containing protein [Burkholderiales bacterium]|nr:sensor histidine kinase N-terminal domain-containing protein [Burkholderiales bacterium]